MTGAGIPRTSAMVPAYNAGPFLVSAIASVRSQSLEDFKAWVIDIGSEDGTVKVAACLTSGRRIRLVSGIHRGISAARNEGIWRSRGRHIDSLDMDDDWYSADKLATSSPRLRRIPTLAPGSPIGG
jgi:glycosyltransferase involved in cell wall biosynthesis